MPLTPIHPTSPLGHAIDAVRNAGTLFWNEHHQAYYTREGHLALSCHHAAALRRLCTHQKKIDADTLRLFLLYTASGTYTRRPK